MLSSNKNNNILNISLSGMFLALGIVLPFLTGNIPEIGSMLCPMHIPIIICGFICGWKYALIIGFITPILRGFLFQAPPLYPAGIAMAFELGTYGFACGILKEISNKNIKLFNNTFFKNYFILIIAMIIGRIVWGVVRFSISQLDQTIPFTISIFITGSILTAWPGIILQLIIIPPLIIILEKNNIINKK